MKIYLKKQFLRNLSVFYDFKYLERKEEYVEVAMQAFRKSSLILLASTLLGCYPQGSGNKDEPGLNEGSDQQSNSLPFLKHVSSLNLTPEQEQCVITYPNLKAENIKAGVTIAGVEGTATEYPACSETITSDCIATADFPAINTEGLASKILTGQTIAGVVGTGIPQKQECTAANQIDCVTTSIYRSIDLSAKDLGGALDLSSSNFRSMVSSTSTFEYWDENGARYTGTGDGDIVAANVNSGVNIFGIDGSALAPDCSSIGVGGTWVLVPGDPDYGTNHFCVMKYEAKNNSGAPTSTASNAPWVFINQQDASTECASLGKGYHLINNGEWMTIATNLANVASNWSGGSVGSGSLFRGHTDDSPNSAGGSPCAASANDSLAYVETDCTPIAAGGAEDDESTQRRTMTLSNGQVIWDFSGNVWEWVHYLNINQKPTPNGYFWSEYPAVSGTSTMPLSYLIPSNSLKSFWTDSWDSNQSIGMLWAGPDTEGGSLHRGGDWDDAGYGGVFAANLHASPTPTYDAIGFRCAVAVP